MVENPRSKICFLSCLLIIVLVLGLSLRGRGDKTPPIERISDAEIFFLVIPCRKILFSWQQMFYLAVRKKILVARKKILRRAKMFRYYIKKKILGSRNHFCGRLFALGNPLCFENWVEEGKQY